MRRFLRLANALAVGGALASALAVLGSMLLESGYRERFGAALWFVLLYAAAQGFMLWAFVRDTPAVPWVAVARAGTGLTFLLTFAVVGPLWMRWTPGRYVYQVFDTEGMKLPLFAMAFLGRGVWNVLSAFYFTQPWWVPLRHRQPLLGRVVTMIPVAAVVGCTWAFLQLVRLEAHTYSGEAHEIATIVLDGLDCATVRARNGQSTTDIRQRGEHRYNVEIVYGCAYTRVRVQAPDGKLGVAGAARAECCVDPG